MANKTIVEYQLKLIDGLSPMLKKIAKQAKKSEQLIKKNFKKIASSGVTAAKKIGAAFSKSFKKARAESGKGGGFGSMLAGVGAGLAVRSIIKTTGEFEAAKVTMETLAGKEIGGDLFKKLTDFANRTPFINTQVNKAAQTLLAFGRDARSIPDDLERLGSVSAGNAERFQSLALVFGQVKAAGRLIGNDLLQFINAGFNPLLIMSKKTGISMADLRKKMSKGGITFEMVRDSIKAATDQGGMFNGLMAKMANTLPGQISTLQGKFQLIQVAIGQALVPTVKALVAVFGGLSDFIQKNKENFIKWVKVSLIVVSAIGAIVIAVKAYNVVMAIAAAISLNPIGIGIAAVAVAFTALISYSKIFKSDVKEIIKETNNLKGIAKETNKLFAESGSKFKTLVAEIRFAEKGSKRHKAAITKINAEYGSILKKRITASTKAKDLLKTEKDTLKVLQQQANWKAISEKVTELSHEKITGIVKLSDIAVKTQIEFADLESEFKKEYKNFSNLVEKQLNLPVTLEGGSESVESKNITKQIQEIQKRFGGSKEFSQLTQLFNQQLQLSDEIKKLYNLGGVDLTLSTKGQEIKDEMINAGGMKQFNINVTKLIGVETLSTTTVGESARNIGDAVASAIIRSISEVNPEMV